MQPVEAGQETAQFQAAMRQGFDGVQPTTSPESMTDERLQALVKAMQSTGLRVPSICLVHQIWYGGILASTEAGRSQAKAEVLIAIRWAQTLGAGCLLVPGFVEAEPKTEEHFDLLVEAFQSLCPVAQAAGVVLGYEHPKASSWFNALADAVGSPAFADYYDTANLVAVGLDNKQEIAARAGRLCEVHVKNYKEVPWDGGLSEGKVDLREAAAALQSIGYNGWYVVETASLSDAELCTDARIVREIFD